MFGILSGHFRRDQAAVTFRAGFSGLVLVVIQSLIMKSERRRKRERKTVLKMIVLFCRGQHGSTGPSLCAQCEQLNRYVITHAGRVATSTVAP
ncbi:MAG: hypothetical protein DRJ61_02480 [Acidobacteria bacterium]|nr:MAG: hypothetical protein DRJ61_02480 [Acidobacteriota bacterium]